MGRATGGQSASGRVQRVEGGAVVGQAWDGLEAGAFEVLADETSLGVEAGLSAPLEAVYPQLVCASPHNVSWEWLSRTFVRDEASQLTLRPATRRG